MVFSRKRKETKSPSFLLDDSPKRTKVQAQRKFAQGSNVNSPVLTPVRDLELQEKSIPEPIELIPTKRPNTEDFLTFLCFRGTPVLPPTLNFFNSASSISDSRQQIESPATSPKNGIILPSTISKTQGERPFIAFGVRKRADPIVVSRHMDKKRRHALALQALRRKYQEQKMAKIRAITISKHSEKVQTQTNKSIVRTTRSLTSTNTITKKKIAQKTKVTVVATKVTSRTSTSIKQPIRTNSVVKQKMCLRSYRGRFVQRELISKPVKKRPLGKTDLKDETSKDDLEFSSEDDEPLSSKLLVEEDEDEVVTKKPVKGVKNNDLRVTRSNVLKSKIKTTVRPPRLLARIQNKLISPPNSPQLRTRIQRNIAIVRNKQIKVPVNTKRVVIKKVAVKNKMVKQNVVKKSMNLRKREEQDTNIKSSKINSKMLVDKDDKKSNSKERRQTRESIKKETEISAKAANVKRPKLEHFKKVLINTKKVEDKAEATKEAKKVVEKRTTREDSKKIEENKTRLVKKQVGNKKVEKNKNVEVKKIEADKKTELNKNSIEVDKKIELGVNNGKAELSKKNIETIKKIELSKNNDKAELNNKTIEEDKKVEIIKNMQGDKKSEFKKNIESDKKTILIENDKLELNKKIIEANKKDNSIQKSSDNIRREEFKLENDIDGNRNGDSNKKIEDEPKNSCSKIIEKDPTNENKTNIDKKLELFKKIEINNKNIEKSEVTKLNKKVQLNKKIGIKNEDAKHDLGQIINKNIANKNEIESKNEIIKEIQVEPTKTLIGKQIVDKSKNPLHYKLDKASKQMVHTQIQVKEIFPNKEVQTEVKLDLSKKVQTFDKNNPTININLNQDKISNVLKKINNPEISLINICKPISTLILIAKPISSVSNVVNSSNPTSTIIERIDVTKPKISNTDVTESKTPVKDEILVKPSTSKTIQEEIMDLRKEKTPDKPNVLEPPLFSTVTPIKERLSLPLLVEKVRRSSLELKLATDNNKLLSDNNKLQADNYKLLYDNNKLLADNNKLVLDNTKLLTDKNKLVLDQNTIDPNEPESNKHSNVIECEEIINNSNIIATKVITEVKSAPQKDKKNSPNKSPEKINTCKKDPLETKSSPQKDNKKSNKAQVKSVETQKEVIKKDESIDITRVSARPSRKTKEAATIYMEILGHKLGNSDIDDDDVSIDSFPELPNVRRTEQRENELKAKAKQKLENSPKSKIPKTPEKKSKKSNYITDDSDESYIAEITIIPEKRSTRIKSPKLYKSFSDTDSEPELIPIKTTKRKSDKSVQISKKVKSCENFNDSDEEPLVKFKKVKEETPTKQTEIIGKQKRECAKRPQNYLAHFSSSEEDEKYFHGFVKNDTPPKAKPEIEATIDALYTKSVTRRYGKERVNMSNEQIEKWLNDSALAGINLIKKENDEMLKFGEKIPSETVYDEIIKIESHEKKEPIIDNISVEKFQNKTFIINEKKTIFRKEKIELSKNINAFSVCNESSVYAFEADNEDSVSTPFRRPSRRPSSTATSKSEDDSELKAAAKFRHPNIIRPDIVKPKPETPPETPIIPKQEPNSMFPPSNTTLQKNKPDSRLNRARCSRSFDRFSEGSEDTKYKVPSSPSASSSSSSKLYKKSNAQKKKLADFYNPVNTSEFPTLQSDPKIVEAPIYRPSEKEFIDPLEYIEKIRHNAEKFGICRIVPPPNFKPECKVLDEMRFTAYNQYVHKMMDRWGPNFREFVAIRKYLLTQNITLKHPPWIGGMEIDLPRLYQTVQTLGGLKEVIEKKKWARVSELMRIPKSAQDRVTKLDDIYCKYLLPYDTLSPDERDKLFDSVETEWATRESKNLLKAQSNDSKNIDEQEESDEDDESDIECIIKGRSIALSAFYRIARNTLAMWFKNPEPTAQEVEEEFWKHVIEKQYHICVHSGSIDSGNWGYGFAVSKNSPFARHAWNLKVLTNNSGSILRSMGPVMGLTVPTLHVGMVFSSCCWYRDPHSLPWIEYLHTGANKIWYSIPDSMGEKFHSTLVKLVPNYCLNKSIWLPSDTAMLPPNLLVDNGISVTKTIQEPGEFVVIFPKAFTSNICTGYTVSESVFFSPPHWLNSAQTVFEELRNSCEPSMFSYERLLLNIASDPRSDITVLNHIIPSVRRLCERETLERGKLKSLGVTEEEKLPMPEVKKKKRMNDTETEYACEDCRWNLFCSMIWETKENAIYCLDHAIEHLEKKKIEAVNCKLMFTYDSNEINNLIDKLKATIEAKIQKKANSKFSGMATLLNR